MKFLMFALITTVLLSNPAISQESDSMDNMKDIKDMKDMKDMLSKKEGNMESIKAESMGNMKEKGMKETAMEGMACM